MSLQPRGAGERSRAELTGTGLSPWVNGAVPQHACKMDRKKGAELALEQLVPSLPTQVI